ncbi:hypothetical protein M5K25_015983 [Dendrobium thyrsiflorum]|uniref:DUF4283 domain-containing protein n=1 Tax=Dendrobium thyrsiflorum TaxID=117978 RepID=A0ABD0URV6_DENTH
MDPSIFPPSSFPPIPNSTIPSSSGKTPNPLHFLGALASSPLPCDFSISSIPTPDEVIDFPTADIADAVGEWNFALVGYSLGKRPFYEALLSAVNNLWKLKGTLKLISLSEGFFLFKFSCSEDFEMVWSKGAWFIFGKPFIFNKWTPQFSPKREEYTSVPIWFKIHDLPLCCWTPTGISKIATKIGIPLAVDSLTASKSRLTFARVCVQVDSSASYPETIPITVEGKRFDLKIQYEWRPTLCTLCNSISHPVTFCPSNPNSALQYPQTRNHQPASNAFRGRSSSRRPRPTSGNPKGILPLPTKLPISNTSNPTPDMDTNQNQNQDSHRPPSPSNLENTTRPIPNLNSPTIAESSSSDKMAAPSPPKATTPSKLISPNKFSVLQDPTDITEMEPTSSQETNPEDPMEQQNSEKMNIDSTAASKPSLTNTKAISQSQKTTRGKSSRKGLSSSTTKI